MMQICPHAKKIFIFFFRIEWFVAPPGLKYSNPVLQKFQDIEENHILHMKEIIHLYSQSVEETHVQIGEVSVSQTFLWVE